MSFDAARLQFSRLGLLLAFSFAVHAGEREYLEVDFLIAAKSLPRALPTSAFSPQLEHDEGKNRFNGRLVFESRPKAGGQKVHTDWFGGTQNQQLKISELPVLDAQLIQVEDHLVPVVRTPQSGNHPHWEWILEPGKAWDEAGDEGWTRAVLPFSLQERNANCTHNGLMSFVFRDEGLISQVAWQIVGETCQYLQIDLWGHSAARYIPEPSTRYQSTGENYRQELAARLPRSPLASIEQDYPNAQATQFDWFPPGETTTTGFIIDGRHYSSGCPTRYGPHPFCETVSLPSYSTAKTLFAGLAYLALAKDQPGIGQTRLLDQVPECRDGDRWQGVTLEHLLDMTTGHYQSKVSEVDEYASYETAFMAGETHDEKLEVACSLFPRREEPGSMFTYHTTDTYLAGLMMNRLIGERDLFRDLIVQQIYEPLKLSPVSQGTRRTYDSTAQPFAGFGLTFTADDIARLGLFLARDHGKLDGRALLNQALLRASLQQDDDDIGIQAISEEFRYNNGFWAYRTDLRGACPNDLWIPYLSGYGGISIALLPNGTVYYVFSDHGRFEWLNAAVASNAIQPFCQE